MVMAISARSSATTITMNFLFIAIILSIGCHHIVESLASSPPSSSSCDTVAMVAPSKSNRVFVAGISRTCTEQTIRSTFSHFGTVQEILLLGQDDKTKNKNRSPYCFVTFENVASAERAIAAPRPTTTTTGNSDSDSDSVMYKEIQYERPKDQSTRRTRSNQSRMQEKERVTRIKEFGQEANLIVQVQSTHMDRMVEHLDVLGRRYKKKNKKNGSVDDSYSSCRVVGSTSANSKNVSLLFLSCSGDPTSLARNICRNPLLARAVNKSYIVQSGLLEGNLATEEGCNAFSNIVFDKILTQAKDQDCNMILRMQVFPPKHQSRLLQSLDQVVYDDDSSKNASRQLLTIDPAGFTHMLSVVEVYQYKGRGWERQQQDPNNRLYMFGVSPASLDLDVVDTNTIIAKDGSDDVNRAYYKLKEAIEMYKELHGELHPDLYQSTALDCGSAPGGWTKYLIEHFHCKTVFSIDPGVLSPSVSKLKETCHMQMKIQDALPILLQENEAAAAKGQIKIWVSDMCLHDMEEQATLLLLAKKKGLLAPNALFVLTLKCLFGHSKLAYDAQVRTVVDKFCGASTNLDSVEIFHLFSNRSGERTVIGYIN